MQISRRGALLGATAAVVTGATMASLAIKAAGVKAALAGQEMQALALFRQLNPARQEVSLMAMRAFLDTQSANEANGWTEEPPKRAYIGGLPS